MGGVWVLGEMWFRGVSAMFDVSLKSFGRKMGRLVSENPTDDSAGCQPTCRISKRLRFSEVMTYVSLR